LQVVNDQQGCPTYTVDLATATLKLIDANARGIHHFCNSEPTTWFNFAREVLRVFEVAGEIGAISSAAWAERYPATATRPAYGVLAVELPARPWRETLPDFRRAIESETN
jgi:dTDP-4-dehydrorhamnose reductase